jgi:hypothetical protein
VEVDDGQSFVDRGGSRGHDVRPVIRHRAQPPLGACDQPLPDRAAQDRAAKRESRGGSRSHGQGPPSEAHQAPASAETSATTSSGNSTGSPVYAAAWSVNRWA